MDKKSYDNGTDFSFVEQKVREVQTTIENAVKTSNYQELNQSITKMVNNTLKQYQKEHTATVQKKTEHKVMNQKIQETHPELYGNTGGEKVKDILLIVFGGLLSGSMAIGLLTVQILQAVIGHGGITSTAVTLIGTLAGVGMISIAYANSPDNAGCFLNGLVKGASSCSLQYAKYNCIFLKYCVFDFISLI